MALVIVSFGQFHYLLQYEGKIFLPGSGGQGSPGCLSKGGREHQEVVAVSHVVKGR